MFECAISGCLHTSRKAAIACNRTLLAVTDVAKLQEEIKGLKAMIVSGHDRQVSLEANLEKVGAERDAFRNENDGHETIIVSLKEFNESANRRIAALETELVAVRKDRDELTTQLARVVSEKDTVVMPTQLENVADTVPTDTPVVPA